MKVRIANVSVLDSMVWYTNDQIYEVIENADYYIAMLYPERTIKKEHAEVIPEELAKDKSTIRVRITGCKDGCGWYKESIGFAYEVTEHANQPSRYYLKDDSHFISKTDCEIVETNTPVLTNHTCSICDYADKRIKCPAPIDNPMSVAPENCEHWKAIEMKDPHEITQGYIEEITTLQQYPEHIIVRIGQHSSSIYFSSKIVYDLELKNKEVQAENSDTTKQLEDFEAENSELKAALEKEQKKFWEMLESEHFISDKYVIIRELVGALNLGDRDKFDATETAILRLKKDRDDAKKEFETIKKAEEKNKAMFDNVLSILNDIVPRSPYTDSFRRQFELPSKIEQLAEDCRDMVKEMCKEIETLNNKVTNLYHREDALLEGMVGLNTQLTEVRNITKNHQGRIYPAHYGRVEV